MRAVFAVRFLLQRRGIRKVPQDFARFPQTSRKISQGFRKISLLEMFFGNHTEKP